MLLKGGKGSEGLRVHPSGETLSNRDTERRQKSHWSCVKRKKKRKKKKKKRGFVKREERNPKRKGEEEEEQEGE